MLYELTAPDSTQLKVCADVKEISMWTEKPIYPLNTSSVDVYVWNPTSTPFSFGRRWNLEMRKREQFGEREIPDMQIVFPRRKGTGVAC